MNKKRVLILSVVCLAFFGALFTIAYNTPDIPYKEFNTFSVIKPGQAEIIISNGTWTAQYYQYNEIQTFQDSNYTLVVEWAMNQTRSNP
jgi:hypothetical protein